jgi:plastocyanin
MFALSLAALSLISVSVATPLAIGRDQPSWGATTTSVPYDPSVYRSTDSPPIEHHVIVGANGSLTFNPPSIKAYPGDTVVSGTQSCHKIAWC